MSTGVFPVRNVGDLSVLPHHVREEIVAVTLHLKGAGAHARTHAEDAPFTGRGSITILRPVVVPKSKTVLSSSWRRRSYAPSTQVISVETGAYWSCMRCHATVPIDQEYCSCGKARPRHVRTVPAERPKAIPVDAGQATGA